jgi:predicted Zn-ribbon and HTH transcriptional regulator
MSQEDIIDMLKKKKEPLTSKELAEYLNIRQENIITNLKKLLKYKEVKQRHPTKAELVKRGHKNVHIVNSRYRIFFLPNSN